ncbi:hypothetical protein DW683_01440 [Bacteroides sp. AM25-34]|nr:hypothetical protein DW267_14165 [Bacteroides sp. AM22-3LB]RGF15319.1 hypothetical protein DW175_12495 [Bacteroides sp. AM16-15]RGI06113.1 hypothetical protein DW683_01440 [Bacteroides sp. AM25-34]
MFIHNRNPHQQDVSTANERRKGESNIPMRPFSKVAVFLKQGFDIVNLCIYFAPINRQSKDSGL